jgi:uncharacterized protein with NAD-binding domain and iron-sulfur cluster
MESEDKPGRLILLGGGIASLTAAFYASAPGHKQVFPGGIHVYEKTAMLGGKGASRRTNSERISDRIEEHGLHVWFGSYDNAFALLAKCHAYLERESQRYGYERWSSSLRDIESGFRPCSRLALMDHDGASWLPWVADFPEDSTSRPWDARAPGEKLTSPSELAIRALRLAEAFLYSVGGQSVTGAKPKSVFLDIEDVPIPIRLPRITPLTDTFDRLLSSPESATAGAEALGRALQVLARMSTELRNRLDEPVRRHSALRRGWQLVDLMLAAVRGLINDGVVSMGDFSLIDGLDLRAWLVLHGASEESVSCGLLKVLAYDLPFAYEAGNPEKASISAAVGLYGLFRILLTYRGAIMWKLNAGMGEVVFAPIYEALLRRGVKFHFGHEVAKIELDDDGDRKRALQISFKKGTSFAAKEKLDLVHVETGPLAGELPYWTSDPGQGEAIEDIQLGSHDMVVYGLPVMTIGTVLERAPQRWLNCCQKVKTVATGCLQLWLNAPVPHYAPWASPDITVGAYTEPFDTWSDMHTLAGEKHERNEHSVKSVAYFCNVFPDDADEPALDQEIASFLGARVAALWPAYRPEMVVDRFRQLNNDPSSRYTLSLPGTLRARLSPRDDSICNVRPVGDWTRTCISAGSIESAVISGMLAATELRPDCPLTIFGEKPR